MYSQGSIDCILGGSIRNANEISVYATSNLEKPHLVAGPVVLRNFAGTNMRIKQMVHPCAIEVKHGPDVVLYLWKDGIYWNESGDEKIAEGTGDYEWSEVKKFYITYKTG